LTFCKILVIIGLENPYKEVIAMAIAQVEGGGDQAQSRFGGGSSSETRSTVIFLFGGSN
jgi:hypothetical protein